MSDKPKKRRAGSESKPKPQKKSTKVPHKRPARKLTKHERKEAKKPLLEEMAADVVNTGVVQRLHDHIYIVIDAIERDNPKLYEGAVHEVRKNIESLVNYWTKCVPETWHDFEVELAED